MTSKEGKSYRFTIAAVIVSVAVPRCRDAAVVVRTAEAVARTRALRAGRIVFIRIVTTVVIAVAEPERFDANVGRITLEMTSWTRRVPGANVARFVRRVGVLAVIDAVANLLANSMS